jgi:hypothetical protein
MDKWKTEARPGAQLPAPTAAPATEQKPSASASNKAGLGAVLPLTSPVICYRTQIQRRMGLQFWYPPTSSGRAWGTPLSDAGGA